MKMVMSSEVDKKGHRSYSVQYVVLDSSQLPKVGDTLLEDQCAFCVSVGKPKNVVGWVLARAYYSTKERGHLADLPVEDISQLMCGPKNGKECQPTT